MNLAVRVAHGAEMTARLERELAQADARHRRGFAVRLHLLGDFWSVEYVRLWAAWLDRFPGLHVFGYTAWPLGSPIGDAVADLAAARWDRFAVRHSVAADVDPAPAQATTIWRKPESHRVAEGLVCPQQLDRTDTCGNCALCWAPAMINNRIVFVGHGNTHPAGPAGPAAPRVTLASGQRISQRQAAVLEMIEDAAREHRQAPTNQAIQDRLGLDRLGRASLLVTSLERLGLISVQRFQTARTITVVGSGESTAPTPRASQITHWRDRGAAEHRTPAS